MDIAVWSFLNAVGSNPVDAAAGTSWPNPNANALTLTLTVTLALTLTLTLTLIGCGGRNYPRP